MTRLATILFLLAAAVGAHAQTTLANNLTLNVGTFTSGAFTVPASTAPQEIKVVVTFSTAQFDDLRNGFTFDVERLDGDGVWRINSGLTWDGGRVVLDGGLFGTEIYQTWTIESLRGRQIRFVVRNNRRRLTGVRVTATYL